MRLGSALGAGALVMLAVVGCGKGPTTMPTRKVPAGIVLIDTVNKPNAVSRFWSNAIIGPVDLAINGVRIPVEQSPKGGVSIEITGLPAGKHRYFISSPMDAFGPDQGEFEVVAGKGTYVLLFNTQFHSTLYGKVEALPKADGLPGVKARLIR